MRYKKQNDWARVAQNPVDDPKYNDVNLPPAPRPIRIDTSDPRLTEDDILHLHYEEKHRRRFGGSAKVHSTFDCKFCEDTKHLRLRRLWVIKEFIPEADAQKHVATMAANTSLDPVYEGYVRCSCASDLTSDGIEANGQTKWKRCRRFTEIFGSEISQHSYGKVLIAQREANRNGETRQTDELAEQFPAKEVEINFEENLQKKAVQYAEQALIGRADTMTEDEYNEAVFELAEKALNDMRAGA